MLDINKLKSLIDDDDNTGSTVIHTPTQESYNDLMKALDQLGYHWSHVTDTPASEMNCFEKNLKSYGEKFCVRLLHKSKNLVYAGVDYYLSSGFHIYECDDLIKDKLEEEQKMINNNNLSLREWAYTKDDIGMTNLARYIYRRFAKKFAKAYKAIYSTEQDEISIETIVYLAFRKLHERCLYYRTPAKNVVMNRNTLDLRSWMKTLRLSTCFISNDLCWSQSMNVKNIDGILRSVSDDHLDKFNELYFKCDTCGCYHEKAKTSNVKVYDHIEDDIRFTCSKSINTDDYKLIGDVYYNKALITDDDTIAEPRIYSYHSYNWRNPKAQAKSLSDNDNSLKMGIEIETYGAPNNSAFVNRYDDHFHCEYDGSLASGNSFEMISVPMTKNYWDSIRNTIIEPLFKTLRDNKQTEGNNGYGLHVHIDSKAFKDIDSVKWFIHNVQLHQRLIQKVARRDSDYYYDYHTSKGLYAIEELNISKLSQDFSSHGTCVNTHMCGDEIGKTVEIRVFKSTLDSETLYSTLRLVENLVRLANEHSTSRRELLRGLKDYAIKQRIVIE